MSDARIRELQRHALVGDGEAKERLHAAVVRSGVHPLLAKMPRCVLGGYVAPASNKGKIHIVSAGEVSLIFYLCGNAPLPPVFDPDLNPGMSEWVKLTGGMTGFRPNKKWMNNKVANESIIQRQISWVAPTCAKCIFICLGLWTREQQRRAKALDPSLLPRGFRARAMATLWEKIDGLTELCDWYSDKQLQSEWVTVETGCQSRMESGTP